MKTPIDEVLEEYDFDKSSLIAILQNIQEKKGYLSSDTIQETAEKIGLPIGKVYGVVTFYSQFRLAPVGKNMVRVCLGTACHVQGGKRILETIENELEIKDGETTEDGKFTVESVSCIGACGLAPVMTINDDTYGRLTPDKLSDILSHY